jgi:maleate cis-trans isomerase
MTKTFRMRKQKEQKEERAALDAESDRCALELSDARVDVLGYACLVAIMAMGKGYHRVSQKRLTERTESNGATAPVITSAGALVEALKVMGAKKIALVAPYMIPLAQVEAQTGKPVLTASIATTYAILKELGLDPVVPGAGALLSGAYPYDTAAKA